MKEMQKIRILFNGDSITDTVRTQQVQMYRQELRDLLIQKTEQEILEETNAMIGVGYPLLAAAQLQAEAPGRYEVLNRAVDGNRIAEIDARLYSDMINLKPDVISILAGVNDAWRVLDPDGNGAGPAKFARIYDSILSDVREELPEVKLILMQPYILQGPRAGDGYARLREAVGSYAAAVERLAEKYGAALIHTQEIMDEAVRKTGGGASFWAPDGVHPSAAGHYVLAQAWLPALRQVLGEA